MRCKYQVHCWRGYNVGNKADVVFQDTNIFAFFKSLIKAYLNFRFVQIDIWLIGKKEAV